MTESELQDWYQLDDDVLVQAHLRGDRRAFEVLFRKHRHMVSRLVLSIVKEPTLVEDVVQEVFLLVYRNLPKFRRQSALKTWIYRITVNEAVRHFSRNKRWQPMPEDDPYGEQLATAMLVLTPGDSPERVVIEGEQRAFVHDALGELKQHHRIILTLYYLEDLSVQEIAEVLSIPEGSVKSRLFYARDSLKKALQPLLERGRRQTGEEQRRHAL